LELSNLDNRCFGDNKGAASVIVRSGGTQPYAYLWNDSEAQTDNTAIELEAGNYTVTITDDNGCTEEGTVEVTQPELPITATFIQTDTACFNQATNGGRLVTQGGTGNDYQYLWSSGSTQNVEENLIAGPQFITITDENNCQTVDTITVTEFDSIAFSIIEVKPTCSDASDGRLALSPISGGVGNGIANNYQINWNTAPSVNQNLLDNLAGNTNYEVTVTDQIGCRQTLNRFLEAPAIIDIVLAKADITCFGSNDGEINVQAINNVGNIASVEWSANASNTTDNQATNLGPGIYTFSLVDDNGCEISVADTINEPSQIVINDFELFPNSCVGDSEGGISISARGGTGTLNFNWSNGSNSAQLIAVPSGNYEVAITDANDCLLTESFELITPDALDGSVTALDATCFEESDGGLTITPIGGQRPFSYSLDGVAFDGFSSRIGLSAGTYTPFIKDGNGCIWQGSPIDVAQPLPFTVSIRSETTTIEQGDSLLLVARFQNNNGNIQYDWTADAANTFVCDSGLCDEILITPLRETRYELYAVDASGCEAEAFINIRVAKSQNVFVPTGFSPNGDGENDFLLVHGKEGLTIQSFTIFDRWGETIYQSNELSINNSKNTWDGTFKGQSLNTGVFVWVLEVGFPDGSVEIFQGSTTLIR